MHPARLAFYALSAAALPAFGQSAFLSGASALGEPLFPESPRAYLDRDLQEQKRFAPDATGDSELGEQLILARTGTPPPYEFDFSTQVRWSDNLANTDTNEHEGFFWENHAELAYRPRVGENFFLDISGGASSYLFEGPSALDFELYSAGIGVVKIFPQFNDLLTYARYQFQHLNARGGSLPEINPQDASYHRIRYGAHLGILSTPRFSSYVALDVAHDIDASPEAFASDEVAARVAASYNFTTNTEATIFYRGGYRDFRNNDATDFHHTGGVRFHYYVTRSLDLYASALLSKNDTTRGPSTRDYESTQIGLGMNYQVKF